MTVYQLSIPTLERAKWCLFACFQLALVLLKGVSNHWSGFSTGMWDWNIGLECGTGQY